ncbi:hypothetical protein CHFL109739_19030 [Chryseobacterium flavum]
MCADFNHKIMWIRLFYLFTAQRYPGKATKAVVLSDKY